MSVIYTYPGTNVLINKADIRDPQELHDFERARVAYRHAEIELAVVKIKGNFDLDHLKGIHKHLFQDVYPFAGEVRTVNIGKNGFSFCNPLEFDRHTYYVFGQLKEDNFLRNLNVDEFSKKAAFYYQEINFGHYFREGNGRSIRTFFEELSKAAGYTLDWSAVPKQEYMAAVKETDDPNKLESLVKVIKRTIASEKSELVQDKQLEKSQVRQDESKEDWIEPKKELLLKDVLKKTNGLPAMDNAFDVDSDILNAPVKKYAISKVNGKESLKFQLKGQEQVHNIRLEKIPNLSKQLKNQMIEQAAGLTAAPQQLEPYMGR
ncbi:Fic/DOC family protein [Paenibacillus chitinolyticus]|uniref:Fic/DOC family protein n=1 Tax=Paenibacillus chitinolyticus TaxID=79263 RepID=UPI001C477FC0|nr:Fic family protein [Paenibacillus chitinolyticus]MBV6717232.1 Fic family protein [Paenibacillus chitinolyticus]